MEVRGADKPSVNPELFPNPAAKDAVGIVTVAAATTLATSDAKASRFILLPPSLTQPSNKVAPTLWRYFDSTRVKGDVNESNQLINSLYSHNNIFSL